jgi:ubiquinol-cytochrome c reductase cytochrome c subunit
MRRLLFVLAMLLSSSSLSAQAPGQAPDGSANRGYKAYMKYQCYTCHGTIGQGGGAAGPRIAPNPSPWAAFELQMRKPRMDMPAYREAFVSAQEVADMYAYLTSIKASPAPKDIPILKFD